MRIIQLTPGTGNFHCGSCLRDHALVSALRKQGDDALMMAMYLPHVLDEPAEAPKSVYFGGINVYLQHKLKLFRHTPRWLDRLFDANWLLNMASKRAGMTKASELGEMTLSMLQGEQGRQIKELNRLIDALEKDNRPDVIMLSNVMLVGMAKRIKHRLNVPVLCTMHGEDGFLDSLPPEYRDTAWTTLTQKCNDVDLFIPVSQYYADVMHERLSIPREKLRVVHNGIDTAGYEPAKPGSGPPVIGYLARQCHPKGLHTLVDAFIHLRKADPKSQAILHVVGAVTDIDEPYVAEQKKKLQDAGLSSQATFEANISAERKRAFLKSLSVLSVPATYGEAFGLYLLEAMACGVPVVQPDHGAFGELLEATGGGILCQPDDPVSLADSLAQLLADESRRQQLAEAGRQAVFERFTHEHMAQQVRNHCEQLTS